MGNPSPVGPGLGARDGTPDASAGQEGAAPTHKASLPGSAGRLAARRASLWFRMPDPDTTLVAVCTMFRQKVAAFEALLCITTDIRPDRTADPEVVAVHDLTGELLRSIQAKVHTIRSTVATGATGRRAKVAALDAYLRTMAAPEGESMEADLARSVVADLTRDGHQVN